MKYLLIDCDPGHDDALAILTSCAHKEELKILGITTVGGNQTLEKVTKNAGNILNFIHEEIPLAPGQEGPLVKTLSPAPEAHGDSGMDGPYFKKKEYPLASDNGVTFLYEKIMESPEKVTIAALAPLTNIALLLKTFPQVKEKISCISMMGGGIYHGNRTALAEFNIYADPEAAQIVFASGLPVVMAGLDVTEKATVSVEQIESLKEKGRVSRLAYELLSFYHETGKQFGFTESPIHDLCAVAYLLEPDMFSGTYEHINVITEEGRARGLTYADRRLTCGEMKNVLVLDQVDRQRFAELLFAALEQLDHKESC